MGTAFFESNAGIDLPTSTIVGTDPGAAWSDALQALLGGPAVTTRELEMPMGRFSVEQAIGVLVTGDVLLHTWDLAPGQRPR